MISIRLKSLLEQRGIPFEVVRHDPAFTAQQLAARIHVPGKEFVKAVVVRLDGRYALAALPAHRLVDAKALARVAGAARCELATEAEFRDLFPECEVGAMPPVGRLYDLPTYVDEEITRDESIVANAGTHAEAIRLRYLDLARVAEPTVGRFGVPSPAEQPRQRAARTGRPSPPKTTEAAGRTASAPSRKTGKVATRKGTSASNAKKSAARKRAPGRKKTATRGSAGRVGPAARQKARVERAGRKPALKRVAGGRKKVAKKTRKKTARKKTAPRKSRHS